MVRKKEHMSVRQLLAEMDLMDVENIHVEFEREGKNIFLSQEAMSALSKMDSNGRLHGLVDTSGRIVEASAAAQLSATSQFRYEQRVGGPTIGTLPVGDASSTNAHKRLAVLPMTTDALGDVGPTPVVTGPAGYYPVMKLLYVYADGTDAAWDLAITVDAGALVGIPAMTGLATTVNVIGPDWTPGGLLFYDTTDATTISFTIANGGNAITYYFVYEYWYET